MRFAFFAYASLIVVIGCSTAPADRGSSAAALGDHAAHRHHARWESRGVGGGGALYGPRISPFDPDEITMATDMTSVFHSRSFGARWETIPFRTLQGGTQSSMQWTSDPSRVYTLGLSATDDPALAISNDRGRTWTALPSPSSDALYAISADPASTERLLVSDSTALYASRDGGQHFAGVYTTPSPAGLVVGGAHWRGDDVFVGTSDGLLVSHDGGGSFALAPIAGIPAGEGIVSFAGATEHATTRFYAVVWTAPSPGITGGDLAAYAGLYRLTEGDAAWTGLATGLGPDDKLSFVAMAPHRIDRVYAAGGALAARLPRVIATRDGGATWRSIFETAHNANIATGWAGDGGGETWGFANYVLGLGVAPTDPERVVITDLGFVHVTRNGGRTWRQAYVEPAYTTPPGALTPIAKECRTAGVDQTSVWWMTWSSPRDVFACFTDITSVQSDDGGRRWARRGDNGLTLNTTYHAVVGADGALYAATSSKHDIYESTTLTDDRLDPQTGAIMRSDDAGRHFATLEDIGHPVVFLATDPRHPTWLYASVVHSEVGGIYRKDLADPATPAVRLAAPPRTEGHPFNVRVLSDGSLVASYSARRLGTGANRGPYTPSAGVFLSTDDGASWLDRTDPRMVYYTKDVVIDPHDPTESTWYAAVFNRHGETSLGGLYRTTDRGVTWQKIGPDVGVESIGIDPRDPDRAYLASDSQGLWITRDLRSSSPTFVLDEGYPFRQPLRIFWNPFDRDEVWVTSFGGGMRVRRSEPLGASP